VFYLEAHVKIFTVLKNLSEKGLPIDVTTVSAELSDRGWLKSIGDVDYLASVINGVASAANIDVYIKIVSDKALLRKLIDESNNIANEAYDTSNDVASVVDNAEKKILGVCKIRTGSEFRSIQEVLFKTQADLEKLAELKGEVTGLATGFYDLDKITSGLHPNELIIIAARPAMGKTAFGINLATNIATNTNKAVALFNLEMGAEQLDLVC
jgi:replicative DNA helicase